MKHLQVAIGIIRNTKNYIFLTQRAADAHHMANKWEFAGGKCEAGETAEMALKRELREETGIEVKKAIPFDIVDDHFNDCHITLHFFLVEEWQGEPRGCEGQPARWVHQSELIADEFPSANARVIARLKENLLR
ncbi:8-oxo-dGTP diphosphatase MutT [Enterobacteriaceae bacterium LUAb1]